MKIYSKKNVVEAALERIRYLFDEFESVIVSFSGGKDSTVTLDLVLKVAKERNRLPLTVMFIDQEAEWKGTIDYMTKIMNDPRIKPMWFQMPMVITNNASSFNRYSYCWDAKDKENWIHPQNEISIKENKYGTNRFHELFKRISIVEFNGKKHCNIAGVRAEETPKRLIALTAEVTYKWITWGKRIKGIKNHFVFYPLYDWSYTDIWKYIHENNLEYNKIYDELYRHGVGLNDMRISNLHHETAIQSLLLVQEIEPDTWNKVVKRIDGASSIKHIKNNSFKCPKELPPMFLDWEEYAMHLVKNIIQKQEDRDRIIDYIINSNTLKYSKVFYSSFNDKLKTGYWKKIIDTVLSSDFDFTKITNWALNPDIGECRSFYKEEWHKIDQRILANPYLTNEQMEKAWNILKNK